jgi:hypothetical protein
VRMDDQRRRDQENRRLTAQVMSGRPIGSPTYRPPPPIWRPPVPIVRNPFGVVREGAGLTIHGSFGTPAYQRSILRGL